MYGEVHSERSAGGRNRDRDDGVWHFACSCQGQLRGRGPLALGTVAGIVIADVVCDLRGGGDRFDASTDGDYFCISRTFQSTKLCTDVCDYTRSGGHDGLIAAREVDRLLDRQARGRRRKGLPIALRRGSARHGRVDAYPDDALIARKVLVLAPVDGFLFGLVVSSLLCGLLCLFGQLLLVVDSLLYLDEISWGLVFLPAHLEVCEVLVPLVARKAAEVVFRAVEVHRALGDKVVASRCNLAWRVGVRIYVY